jgi:hypothetical protein
LQVGLKFQKDDVAHREDPLRAPLVCVMLHSLLHAKEMLAFQSEDQRALVQPSLNI